jgi:hypothetical protein
MHADRDATCVIQLSAVVESLRCSIGTTKVKYQDNDVVVGHKRYIQSAYYRTGMRLEYIMIIDQMTVPVDCKAQVAPLRVN